MVSYEWAQGMKSHKSPIWPNLKKLKTTKYEEEDSELTDWLVMLTWPKRAELLLEDHSDLVSWSLSLFTFENTTVWTPWPFRFLYWIIFNTRVTVTCDCSHWFPSFDSGFRSIRYTLQGNCKREQSVGWMIGDRPTYNEVTLESPVHRGFQFNWHFSSNIQHSQPNTQTPRSRHVEARSVHQQHRLKGIRGEVSPLTFGSLFLVGIVEETLSHPLFSEHLVPQIHSQLIHVVLYFDAVNPQTKQVTSLLLHSRMHLKAGEIDHQDSLNRSGA